MHAKQSAATSAAAAIKQPVQNNDAAASTLLGVKVGDVVKRIWGGLGGVRAGTGGAMACLQAFSASQQSMLTVLQTPGHPERLAWEHTQHFMTVWSRCGSRHAACRSC